MWQTFVRIRSVRTRAFSAQAAAALLLGFACAGGDASAAQAESDPAPSYPNRPIRLIAQFLPGTTTDIIARFIGAKLTEAWGQQVVIDNRPGAGGTLGTELAARAVPDGYTLVMAPTGAFAIAPGLYPKLQYDPIRDFAPVISIVSQHKRSSRARWRR